MGDIEGCWIISLTQISLPQDRKTPVEMTRLLDHTSADETGKAKRFCKCKRATAIQRSKRQYWKESTIID